MDTPGDTRPKRQNSAVSSASSGNRTIRASSTKGRRRSSASQTSTAASALLARLTGRNKPAADDEVGSDRSSPSPSPGDSSDADAGPSDYWRRSPPTSSPVATPPAAWRTLSNQKWPDDLEDGPLDVWRPGTPPTASATYPRTPPFPMDSPGVGTPDPERVDDDEYERRMHDVFSHTLPSAHGVQSNGDGDTGVSIDSKEQLGGDDYDAELREIMGTGEKDGGIPAIQEEELPELEFPQRDDTSGHSPSISSASAIGSAPRPGVQALISNNLKRSTTPYLHPSVSRLRSSHLRTASSTTQNSLTGRPAHLAHSRMSSHFSQISMSRSESMSSVSAFNSPLLASVPAPVAKVQPPAFSFRPLRHLSAHLFSRKSSGRSSPSQPPAYRKGSSIPGLSSDTVEKDQPALGRPTVMDVRGMIAVGTENGYVVVYGYGQDIRCILGLENSAGTSGAVTAVAISSDQTYIAVGHATGNIHLYDLSKPSKAARSVYALTINQVLSGRKEGHLQGSRILHLGFVGARHTSLISGDEHGRAFWWSLGKVMGVESNDVVRLLGSYPEAPVDSGRVDQTLLTANPPQLGYPSKKPTTLFAAAPLPLGEASHATDTFQLTALLTPSKIVIVGMKPSPKTWFRKMRDTIGGQLGGLTGCAVWLQSGELDQGSDPVLAYSWGTQIRFLRVRAAPKQSADSVTAPQKQDGDIPQFVESRSYDAPNPILALQWYDRNNILLVTTDEIILLNVTTLRAEENTVFQMRLLTSNNFYLGLNFKRPKFDVAPESVASSARVNRGKLFLLTQSNVQVGDLLHWNDRILARVHQGDFLNAIQVALAYYEGRAAGNSIGLPDNADERRDVIGTRIRSLLRASLEWAFSEDRMHDDTHYSSDGRGVDLSNLFEGLATSCIEACLSMGDVAFLFDDTYESYANVGIQGIFLRILEPYIFDGRVREVPPHIIQALISMHDSSGELDLAEAVIWHVDPVALDINQAVILCEQHKLWDALIHVYTRAMRDYVAPIVKLMGVIQDIQDARRNRPHLVGEGGTQISEAFAADAYKLFAYIEQILSGLSYPTGETLPATDADRARVEVYGFIFSGRPLVWPDGPEGDIVLPRQSDKSYPYLDLLLQFDTEAFLHSMDIAFEDSYLNDSRSAVSRQTIINIMLDSMNPNSFYSSDITLLHIFVARNLPKYPQFLFIPPSTLHAILVSLASDPDQSTREDRQLAAEYLLSAYTPHDLDAMLRVFEQARFFRILRDAYRREKRWAPLIDAFVKDPDVDDGVFRQLAEVIQTNKKGSVGSSDVTRGITEALPYLIDISVRQTALLLDRYLPSLHSTAIKSLATSEHRQMAYLRFLLDPSGDEGDEGVVPTSSSDGASAGLDIPARHLYVSLLSKHDSSGVIHFLDIRGPAFFDLPRLVREFEVAGHFEGQLWALDRQGKTKDAFDTVAQMLQHEGADLGEAVLSQDEGSVHVTLQNLQSVTRMAVRICQERSSTMTEGVEDMWYGLLHEMIELNHSVASLVTNRPDQGEVAESLRALVQETLQSLVSSSSPSLSFPRLFKRLVESSTTTSKASKKGRAYSEFRSILTGMLDSYRAEGDMLRMTTRLVEADLFVQVKLNVVKRQQGWRPHTLDCERCGKGLFEEKKGELDLSETIVILGSGMAVHSSCGRE